MIKSVSYIKKYVQFSRMRNNVDVIEIVESYKTITRGKNIAMESRMEFKNQKFAQHASVQ